MGFKTQAWYWPGQAHGMLALVALLAVSLWLGAGPSRALAGADTGVRLVMVEEKGCRYCKAWDADIGGIYHKTSEGRFAPLKRVRRGAPEIKGFNPVVYTPTFILVRSGEEVGRITGYPGKGYFFEELEVLLSAIGYFPSL